MRAVNLLPKDAERAARAKPNLALLVGVAGFAVVSAVLLSMYMSASTTLQNKKDQRADLSSQIKIPAKAPEVVPIQSELASTKALRISALSSALSYRVPWDVVLGQISAAIPTDVSLTSLVAKAPVQAALPTATAGVATATSTGATTPTGLSIQGWTYSQESVVRLLKRLDILPALKDVTLQESNRTDQVGQAIYSFTIVATVRMPGTTQ